MIPVFRYRSIIRLVVEQLANQRTLSEDHVVNHRALKVQAILVAKLHQMLAQALLVDCLALRLLQQNLYAREQLHAIAPLRCVLEDLVLVELHIAEYRWRQVLKGLLCNLIWNINRFAVDLPCMHRVKNA